MKLPKIRLRAALALCIALVTILAGLVAWWTYWVPNWRPSLNDGERLGIDVSSHQGSIDWPQVARDGIEFAYVKATEGRDFTDERFAENWMEAREAGLDVGAYHFFTLCSPGADQARHFLEVARPELDALPPAVDLELAGNCSARPPRPEFMKQLDAFLQLVDAAWRRSTIVYLGDDLERAYSILPTLDRPLWLHRFLMRPSVERWSIWQLHGYARVEGIDGGVDLDVMRGVGEKPNQRQRWLFA